MTVGELMGALYSAIGKGEITMKSAVGVLPESDPVSEDTEAFDVLSIDTDVSNDAVLLRTDS
jgi:hypothetical protein